MRSASFWDFALAVMAGNAAAFGISRLLKNDPLYTEPARLGAFWLVGGLTFAVLVTRPAAVFAGSEVRGVTFPHTGSMMRARACC